MERICLHGRTCTHLFVDLLKPLTSAENFLVTLMPRKNASGSSPSHSFVSIIDVLWHSLRIVLCTLTYYIIHALMMDALQ